jgi:hypothetical protein
MNKIYEGKIFADYYQFYIFDASQKFWEDMPDWHEENAKKGYISNGRTIYLATMANFNYCWLEVYLSDCVPSFDTCERALSININIASGKLGIATPNDRMASLSVKSGSYIAYVLTFNLGVNKFTYWKTNEDFLNSNRKEVRTNTERYTIILMPGSTQKERVIKGAKYLYSAYLSSEEMLGISGSECLFGSGNRDHSFISN